MLETKTSMWHKVFSQMWDIDELKAQLTKLGFSGIMQVTECEPDKITFMSEDGEYVTIDECGEVVDENYKW